MALTYLGYPVVDIPKIGAYIPVYLHRWWRNGIGQYASYWGQEDVVKAIIPDPSDLSLKHVESVKLEVRERNSHIIKYVALPVMVPPAPKDLSGNLIYKMSDLAPAIYKTDILGGFNTTPLADNKVDYSSLKTFAGMFKGCTGMEWYDGQAWDLSPYITNILDFKEMFAGCSNLQSVQPIDLSGLNNANYDVLTYADRVKDMFKGCTKLDGVRFLGVTNNNLRQVLTPKYLGCPSTMTITIL